MDRPSPRRGIRTEAGRSGRAAALGRQIAGAEVHQAPGPSLLAGPRPPSLRGEGLEARLGGREARRRTRTAAPRPARHCRRRHWPNAAEGDRRDRRRRIVADAGKFPQVRSLWPGTARHARPSTDPGAGEQVAGAGVVAEPRPGGHDILVPGARARSPTEGQRRVNSRKYRRRVRDRGLLEHDLGQPHPIGIGGLARLRAPGQVAAMRHRTSRGACRGSPADARATAGSERVETPAIGRVYTRP